MSFLPSREEIIARYRAEGLSPAACEQAAAWSEELGAKKPNRVVVWVSDGMLARLEKLLAEPGTCGISDLLRGLLWEALDDIDEARRKKQDAKKTPEELLAKTYVEIC